MKIGPTKAILTPDQWIQTRIDSKVTDFSGIIVRLSSLQYYRAGTTASFATSQLGPFQTMLRSNKVQQRPSGVWI